MSYNSQKHIQDDLDPGYMKHVNFDSRIIDETYRTVDTIETSADLER